MKSYDLADVLCGVLPVGCAEPHVHGFVEHLENSGYSILTTREYVRSAGHFGRWLDERERRIEDLRLEDVEEFARHLCACPGASRPGRAPSRRYVRRVRRFVGHLLEIGVVSVPPDPPAPRVPAVLVGFRDWMIRHRGVRGRTVDRYERLVVKMLPGLGYEPAAYDAAAVRRVLLDEVRGLGLAYAQTFVTAFRAFLRFLATEGRCRPHLDRAVPTIPQWTLSSLSHHLPAEEVERIIASCDLEQPHGVRDCAILLLLARLGLRAGDIVEMWLGDIDWATGTLRVRGKARRETTLPLPQDAGDALLRYLVDVRPGADTDHVFLCAQAPIRPFATSAAVSSLVMLALQRAGTADTPSRGAHLLRHSAAVSMLQSGVSIEVISTVLRHSSSDMTAYYAKVDVALLQTVAQPWPEGAPC